MTEPTTNQPNANEPGNDDSSCTEPKGTGSKGPPRRGFLRIVFGSFFGVGLSALGIGTAAWSAATARFMLPNTLAEPPDQFKAGFAADYPSGHVETRYKQVHGAWIVRETYDGRDRIFALRTACTHLGCITIWQESERKFKCPCHGSGFYASGQNFEGPAPRPLERYAIRVADDGQLEIDKSRLFHEELGQWNDPASFVNV